jgi:nucleoside-diphosphate kinase
MEQTTLLIVKPDALQKGVMGAVLSRVEQLKLRFVAAKVVRPTRELVEEHYQHIKGRPFFQETVEHMLGKLHGVPYAVAFILRGEDAIARLRQIAGATDPEKADPQSLRGQFGRTRTSGLMENVLHASSDPTEAQREIGLWFGAQDLAGA